MREDLCIREWTIEDVYTSFVNYGYSEHDAHQCVDAMVDAIGEPSTIYLCMMFRYRFNHDEWCVEVRSRVSAHTIENKIYQFVGELNHYTTHVGIIHSLVCDSMWSLEQILGREPIVVD